MASWRTLLPFVVFVGGIVAVGIVLSPATATKFALFGGSFGLLPFLWIRFVRGGEEPGARTAASGFSDSFYDE